MVKKCCTFYYRCNAYQKAQGSLSHQNLWKEFSAAHLLVPVQHIHATRGPVASGNNSHTALIDRAGGHSYGEPLPTTKKYGAFCFALPQARELPATELEEPHFSR